MKYRIIIILFFIPFISIGQQKLSGTLAFKIAKNVKDSLNLTPGKESDLQAANNEVINYQQKAILKYKQQRDSLAIYLQKAESLRDLKYKHILGDSLYSIYKQKKAVLIKVN